MDLLELQQRANILVNKVNEYEANLQGTEADENTLIDEHKYADIFCLRPVLKLLFGKNLSEKLDRYTVNDLDIRMISSSAPAWNRYFTFFKQSEGYITKHFEQPVLTADGTIGEDTFAVGCFGGGRVIDTGYPYKATNPTRDRFDYSPSSGDYATLVYYYSEPLRATSFILNSSNAGDANFGLIPRTAELYGSNDVENWQDLSKYTLIQSYDFGSDGENYDNHEYLIGNVKSYKLYAFRVTKTNYAHNRCMIGYFRLVGTVQEPITEPSYFISGDTHEFATSIDMWNDYNMTQLDVLQNTLDDREPLIEQGIRFAYSSNIKDALVTECQTANVFKWNTTNSKKLLNNEFTTPRQVPGIVLYYLGNDYTGKYTATIPYNFYSSNLNDVTYEKPPLYGAYYSKDETTSQVGLEMGAECCRIFIPGCSYLAGRLISPQMIWQPNQRVGDDNVNVGFNWQGQAIYHELVFKQRRAGCKDANVDFSEEPESVADNDPQGLATRLVLAQMKPYYFNRPWFNELNELSNIDTKTLADNIIEKSSEMNDITFYNSYKLDYETWANATNKPL